MRHSVSLTFMVLISMAVISSGAWCQSTVASPRQGSRTSVNVLDFGAKGNGTADDGPAIATAIATASADRVPLVFPPSRVGYQLASGTFSNRAVGMFRFNENVFSGAAVGHTDRGEGRLNSLYTNAYLQVVDDKYELDPAGVIQGNNTTNIGIAVECLPNHPNANALQRNWIACVYRGADTGTGGRPGSSISTEVDNDVLNLNSNSGTDMEIDVNVNGNIADEGISRGLFIVGGGGTGRTWNGVAIDIGHSAYDGSWLPWTQAIVIRQATTGIEFHKTMSQECCDFIRSFDEKDNETFAVDKNGYVFAPAVILRSRRTPKPADSCRIGEMHADDDYIYVCTSNGHYKRAALNGL